MNPLRLWLNGTEIKSTLEVVTLAGNETRYYDLTPFLALLVPGTNTLAAQLPNTIGSDYDDIAFDLSLKAVPYHPVSPRLNVRYTNGAPPTITAETPTNSIWELQSCDLLSTNSWQVMLTFTNLAGGVQSFSDTGQGNRALPVNVRGRYYRLVPY